MSEDLEGKVKDLEASIDDARFLIDHLGDRVDELEEELTEKDQRIRELKQTVESLEDRDRLMQEVHRNAADTPTKRAVRLIQTLNNEAVTNGQAGQEEHATMTAREAMKCLGGDVSRPTIYPTFDRAVELVGDDDVLEYRKEDRSSPKKSRLILDLEVGDLPSTIAGYDIRCPTYEQKGSR
ncbi:hypothetical protein [Halobiforma nitratireducens]|uniref:Uncharacterized protein n=1 Tax=Halobiforma nitratireducens JCM 10879 TaxID=1227454 RepID=M0L719_9EURY|nr:hypothetical protein [Halobiforma nitratireducens]EMA29387.1 hypothetical protein C446_17032 [Halobiforma nitratireducens JCM 10879]